jgi:hypothetical protein
MYCVLALTTIHRYDKAKKYYSKAKDYLSLVRIACFKVRRLSKCVELALLD